VPDQTSQLERLTSALASRYRIERELGHGGMATVYLAEDLKHHRKVAVKVLRPELAAVLGAERFLKEIEVTANLQHPQILPLHDSGEADSFLYYVMPYVEGESLREKLRREKQLAVEESIEIATAVASALDYAHRHGVIHRDIKPENILLHETQPVVADFGIALAVTAAGGTRLTETGLSLGTPEYMSPEQATGDRELDARSDVYSLGAVVYEMLTGDPPHAGNTIQAIIAKVLSEEPTPITRTRSLVPANVDAAVQRALAKVPADRFATASQFADALTNLAFALPTTGMPAGAGVQAPGLWKRLSVGLAAFAAVMTVLFIWSLLRPWPESPVLKMSLALPEGEEVVEPVAGPALALSADGSTLVYLGSNEAGGWQLWVRRRDELRATPMRGTEGAICPALSPDGREVVYVTGAPGPIKVVPLQGGTPRTLVDSALWVGDWGEDGAVYYTDLALGISRVPAGGGEPEVITTVDAAAGEVGHGPVNVLPSGRGAVFTIERGGGVLTEDIAAVQFATGEVTVLARGTLARYAATGHLLWTTADGTLMAAPFDEHGLSLTGPAMPVLEGVRVNPIASTDLALSQTGTLVYRTGGMIRSTAQPVWVERDGTTREIDPGWRIDILSLTPGLALSPDGSRLAVTKLDGGDHNVWIKRLDTGQLSRLTFEGKRESFLPSWTPDGRSVVFLRRAAGLFELWMKRADGAGSAELLWQDERHILEGVFSHSGAWLVYRLGIVGDLDLYAIRPGLDSVGTALLATEFSERAPVFSPDDRWLAHVSNQTGRDEVYVSPFPNVADWRLQVSTARGVGPVWAHSGEELFYRNGANELVAVEVTADSTFSVGQQRVLFSMAGFATSRFNTTYNVSLDDQRFVMLRRIPSAPSELIWIENFFEELKAKVGN
jgi:serine/threonine-protein kinase